MSSSRRSRRGAHGVPAGLRELPPRGESNPLRGASSEPLRVSLPVEFVTHTVATLPHRVSDDLNGCRGQRVVPVKTSGTTTPGRSVDHRVPPAMKCPSDRGSTFIVSRTQAGNKTWGTTRESRSEDVYR